MSVQRRDLEDEKRRGQWIELTSLVQGIRSAELMDPLVGKARSDLVEMKDAVLGLLIDDGSLLRCQDEEAPDGESSPLFECRVQ